MYFSTLNMVCDRRLRIGYSLLLVPSAGRHSHTGPCSYILYWVLGADIAYERREFPLPLL